MSKDKYESFYRSLDLDFQDMDLTSQEQLKLLMQNLKYHVKKDISTGKNKKENPTDKQLVLAWDYLKTGKKVHRFE